MKLVQSGGWFDVRVNMRTKQKYFFSKKNVGKAEISLLRSLFYDLSENDIIEYILTNPISTKRGKYNMLNKPGRAVHDYQNMNIWFGRRDGSESDFFYRFINLPRTKDRVAVLDAVKVKINANMIIPL